MTGYPAGRGHKGVAQSSSSGPEDEGWGSRRASWWTMVKAEQVSAFQIQCGFSGHQAHLSLIFSSFQWGFLWLGDMSLQGQWWGLAPSHVSLRLLASGVPQRNIELLLGFLEAFLKGCVDVHVHV